MNDVARQVTDNSLAKGVLYMALELSQSKWRLAFSDGLNKRQKVIDAGQLGELEYEIARAKEKFKLDANAQVISCYEAGRDGFWIHRYLETNGIKNHVIDSSSIDVNRKHRRAKTDRIDAEKLLIKLLRYVRGEDKLSIAKVPSEEEEDVRRINREREALKQERTRHTNRIKSFLALHGINFKGKGNKSWDAYLEKAVTWKNESIPKHQLSELRRIVERLKVVENQFSMLEKQVEEATRTSDELVYQRIRQLKNLKGIGDVGALGLVMEWFGWRDFKNRREVGAAAGLVGTPHDSGKSRVEQGISKAGNSRIRTLMIQLAWCWLRYQPNSELSLWFKKRFEHGARIKKVGIVALARKLLIGLWRYIKYGIVPAGANLKSVNV